MSAFYNTHVRKTPFSGHDHVVAVRTLNGDAYPADDVVRTLGWGDSWSTDNGHGGSARVSSGQCEFGCSGPYIGSDGDTFSNARLADLPGF